MNKIRNAFTLLGFILVLAGCASIGAAPAQSFDEKLAYAYGTHTAVEQAAAASVTSGAISKADGEAVLALADQSKALLDSARAVEATNATDAGNKLVLAISVLTQVQTYIQTHSGSKSP